MAEEASPSVRGHVVPKPEGWWSLSGLSGSVDGVLKAIAEAKDVPDRWKGALKEEVMAAIQGTDNNYLELHAHFTLYDKLRMLNISVTASKKLL